MRNFFQFIWNNQFTFLFFALEFLGFALLTSNNSFHNSKIQSTSAAFAGSIASVRDGYAQYIGLREENEKLLEENRRLKDALRRTSSGVDRPTFPFKFKTAHAINSTYHLGNNFILLDRGSEDGIKPQQGVIGPQGVVGIVHTVSDHYSSVIPLIHSQTQLTTKLKKNNYFGRLMWDGKEDGFAQLEDIPNHIGVFTGDTIVTRGASGIFPPNLLVGTAVSSEKDESSGFQTVTVDLATDFRRVYNLYILEPEAKQELDSLVIEAIDE